MGLLTSTQVDGDLIHSFSLLCNLSFHFDFLIYFE